MERKESYNEGAVESEGNLTRVAREEYLRRQHEIKLEKEEIQGGAQGRCKKTVRLRARSRDWVYGCLGKSQKRGRPWNAGIKGTRPTALAGKRRETARIF